MTTPLPDTAAVADFMAAFNQTVRTTPTTAITNDERVLRARLVVEEAIEFARAMGCQVAPAPDGTIEPKTVQVTLDPSVGIDLVEAADAIGDLTVVTKGSAHTLGINPDKVFEIVHETNMAKLGPDGHPTIRESDGKVLKPDGWVPPTDSIRAHLIADGWNPDV